MTVSDQPQEAPRRPSGNRCLSSLRNEIARAIREGLPCWAGDGCPRHELSDRIADAVLVVVRARAEQLAQELDNEAQVSIGDAVITYGCYSDAAERIRGLFNEGNR